MAARNPITGDAIQTKGISQAYRDNYGGITKECPECGKKTPIGSVHTCSPLYAQQKASEYLLIESLKILFPGE